MRLTNQPRIHNIIENMDDLDAIKQIMQETAQQQKKTEELVKENTQGIKELREESKDLRGGIRELREELREGIRELREELKEGIRELREEFGEGIRELKEAQKKTDEQIKRTDKKMNSFLGNYGEVAEEYFYQSLADKMSLGEIKFDEIDRRVRYDSQSIEFDIMLYNGESVGIVEVKSKVHPKEIKSLAESKVLGFRRDYPEQSQKKIYFGIASMVTNPAMVEAAKENQIFLLTQKGEHLEIVNEKVKAY